MSTPPTPLRSQRGRLAVLGIALVMAVAVLFLPRLAMAGDEHDATPDHHAAAADDDHHAAAATAAAAPGAGSEEDAEIDAEIDADLKGAPPATDQAAYAAFLRAALAKARPHVISKLEQKMRASQSSNMNRLSTGLFLFSLLGLLLLFRPLFLAKRYPGKAATLFKYSALSAGLFFLTVNLFAMVIGLLKVAQGSTAHLTNPQIAVVDAAFDVLDKNADSLVVLGPKLIEPSLHGLARGDGDFVVSLLENFKGIKSDVDAILAIAKMMKALDGVLAYLPALLTVIAIITFALSAKDTLLAIVRLPETAVESGGAGVVIRGALRRVKNELLATLCLVGCLILLAMGGGVALRAAVEPAVESFLDNIFLAAIYIQVEKVSSVVLFGGLALSALVLVLNIGVVMAASSAVLGKLHQIFQRKFHEGLPLRAHGRFWKRAPLALLVCFLFPWVYNLIAEKGVEAFLMHTLHAEHPSYGTALVGSPLTVVVGFFVCFAIVLGGHAMVFLFRYPVKTIALAPQPAMPGPVPVAFMAQTARPAQAPVVTMDLSIFDRLVVSSAPSTALTTTAPTQLSPAVAAAPSASMPFATDVMPQQAPLAPESDVAGTTVFRRGSGLRPLPPVATLVSPKAPDPHNVDDTVQMPSLFNTPAQHPTTRSLP